MLVRFAFVVLLALVPGTTVNSAPNARVSFFDEEPPPPTSQCGSSSEQGPSFDDPSVDTDPDRPIMEMVSSDNENGDSSDDDADGMCRSQTLELWFPPEHSTFQQAALTMSPTRAIVRHPPLPMV